MKTAIFFCRVRVILLNLLGFFSTVQQLGVWLKRTPFYDNLSPISRDLIAFDNGESCRVE